MKCSRPISKCARTTSRFTTGSESSSRTISWPAEGEEADLIFRRVAGIAFAVYGDDAGTERLVR